jgi:hypothetical protein
VENVAHRPVQMMMSLAQLSTSYKYRNTSRGNRVPSQTTA